jgi:mannonate dehydratase
MKLGFGLYKHMLNEEHYRFARQCGATHVVVHLVDYFGHERKKTDQPVGALEGWGDAGIGSEIWSAEYLHKIKKEVNDHGLVLEAIENFDPAHWHDILLDGPLKHEQMESIKQLIRNVGAVGIPVFGYNFSLAGVCGRTQGSYARGGAVSVGMEGTVDAPIPKGMVWNMTYDHAGPDGFLPNIHPEELWNRVAWFLSELLPVAEEAGVVLAAHPDDPPMPTLRSTPRLVYQPGLYQRLIDLNPSGSNKLEFCLGSISEMTEGDIYEATDNYAQQNRIAYVHFRNVKGKAPYYREVFIDEGDIDMLRILTILKKNNFEGVLIPDHTPQMTCSAPWYAGMAYAMGYMNALLHSIVDERNIEQ